MNPADIDPAIGWAVAALLLGIAELVLPGVFLGFLAIAAALTAGLSWAIQPPAFFQFLAFSILSIAAVLGGRRWYRDHPIRSSDPLLNEPSSRMIGTEVRVVRAIADGRGRVRIGDGEWAARGPAAEAGAIVRIVEVDGATVVVEPVARPS